MDLHFLLNAVDVCYTPYSKLKALPCIATDQGHLGGMARYSPMSLDMQHNFCFERENPNEVTYTDRTLDKYQCTTQSYNSQPVRGSYQQQPEVAQTQRVRSAECFDVRMKKRSQLSKQVLEYLKEEFMRNKFPDTYERDKLSALLQVPAKSIQSTIS